MMKKIDQLFQQALHLHQRGEIAQARDLYHKIVILDPQHADSLHLLGVIHAQQRDFETGLIYVERALKFKPDMANYHDSLGNILQHLQRNPEAVQHYEQALKLNPDSAQTHNNLANLLMKQNELLAAIKHYAQATHLQPDYAAAHFNLGNALVKKGEIDAAIKQFKNVITLNPDNISAYKMLGDLYFQQQDLTQARPCYQAVLTLDPENTEALNNLGVCFLKTQQAEKAIEYFNKVLALDEKHQDARNNLAATYLQQERYDNAARHYQMLLDVDLNNSEAQYNLGVCLMALGKLEDAIKHFEANLNSHKDNIDALINLGAVYLKLNQEKTALTYYQSAKAIAPTNPTVNYMLHALQQNSTPQAAPQDYVKNLFDNYAGYYEKHVAEVLHYQVPQSLRASLNNYLVKRKNLAILDLGCGSGMSGAIFQDMASRLTGIDLSQKMLNLAEIRNIYTQLIQGEIAQVLAEHTQKYDLILAADVFVYIGDLNAIFQHCQRLLKNQGFFAFTVEASKHCPYVLQKTARYAHCEKYLKELAAKHQFTLVECQKIQPRWQNEKPIEGYLVILQKKS